jgi:hypothetical protein
LGRLPPAFTGMVVFTVIDLFMIDLVGISTIGVLFAKPAWIDYISFDP